jgi:hypothetical protein
VPAGLSILSKQLLSFVSYRASRGKSSKGIEDSATYSRARSACLFAFIVAILTTGKPPRDLPETDKEINPATHSSSSWLALVGA